METALAWTALDRAYGLIAVRGEDARAFLHGQLTNDIAGLDARHARRAGWCSAKGRLLASFLVIPREDGFLLQLSRDLVPTVIKRFSMFVLRAKVRLGDESDQWAQAGAWGSELRARLAQEFQLEGTALACAEREGTLGVSIDEDRLLLLVPAQQRSTLGQRFGEAGDLQSWERQEIRAGRPLIVAATQDLFVPQMVNLERLGGVDFKKGCYPGQEIVARTQYRGQLKRRMVRAIVSGGAPLSAGQELFCDDLPGQAGGNVVNVVRAGDSDELLAVVSLSALDSGAAIRIAPGGPALEIQPLPYAL